MPALDPRSKKTTLILSAIQECKCGTRIDVSRFEAFQELVCPGCAKTFVVQGIVDPAYAGSVGGMPEIPGVDPVAQEKKRKLKIGLACGGALLLVIAVGTVMVKRSRARNAVSPIPTVSNAQRASTESANIETARGAAAPAPARPSAQAVGEGVYKLANRATGQVLDVYAWNSNSDAAIKMWGGGTGLNQRWIVRPMSGGYQLIAYHSCKALEVLNGAAGDDATIRQAPLSGAGEQIWKLQSVGEGFYRIVSDRTGKALTVLDTVAKSGSPVGQRDPSSSPIQQWRLEPLGGLPAELDPILGGKPLGAAPPPVRVTSTQSPTGSKFVPIALRGVMNCDSRAGNFSNPNATQDSVHSQLFGWVSVAGVPFEVLDPAKTNSGKNLLILRGGMAQAKTNYPKKVEVPVNGAPLTKLHFISGIAGWGYPWDRNDKHLGVMAGQVTVVRKGGAQQILQFRNGIEFADYHARNDVPGSAFIEGFASYARQARYFTKDLSGTEPVEKLIIESFETNLAPVYVAITGETAR